METELFWKLLEPVHPTATSLCRRLAGNRDEGDDLYQDAVLVALRYFHGLKDQAAFRPWFFRIIINTAKNRYRSFWWRRRSREPVEEFIAGHDPQDAYDLRRLLNQALARLSAEDRALVILHEIEGWPVGELTALCHQSEAAIKTRLFRARRKMRKWLRRRLPEKGTICFPAEATYALQRSKTADD